MLQLIFEILLFILIVGLSCYFSPDFTNDDEVY